MADHEDENQVGDEQQPEENGVKEDEKPKASAIQNGKSTTSTTTSSEPDYMRKLFIGGLSYTTDDDSLKDFYSQWGEVVDCIVMRDQATKRSRGFGFVTFARSQMVDDAMEARPHTIDGKQVEPKRAIPRDQASGKQESNMSVKKLYVSGVREEHTDEMFKEHFAQFGNVTEVDLITDKNTGKKRGFAFIQFDDYDAVDKCVLQRSHMIDGKRCDVKKALSKEDMNRQAQRDRERQMRDGRGGGGRGGYGGGGGGAPWAGGPQQQMYGGGGWGDGGYGGGGYGGGQMGYGGGGGWGPGGAWQQQGGGGWGGQGGYGGGQGQWQQQGGYGGGQQWGGGGGQQWGRRY